MSSTTTTNPTNTPNTLPNPPPFPRTNEGIRVCQVIAVKQDALDEYRKVHAAVWPSVLAALRRAHIFDYSIHLVRLPLPSTTPTAPTLLLVAHMRYCGGGIDDMKRDLAEIGRDEETRRWWQVTDPMQSSFVPGAVGSAGGTGWWLDAEEELFRMEG
ncbi:hypothetical protein DFJ73DRAFT_803831 [Zopfochytrium polystomum]|nr:hypothetical protein DFJ73DRAFT_803831 [Zopfochytrium polystomum]